MTSALATMSNAWASHLRDQTFGWHRRLSSESCSRTSILASKNWGRLRSRSSNSRPWESIGELKRSFCMRSHHARSRKVSSVPRPIRICWQSSNNIVIGKSSSKSCCTDRLFVVGQRPSAPPHKVVKKQREVKTSYCLGSWGERAGRVEPQCGPTSYEEWAHFQRPPWTLGQTIYLRRRRPNARRPPGAKQTDDSELRVSRATEEEARTECAWLKAELKQWLDDEYCPEPANEDISNRCAKVYYRCLMEGVVDIGDILVELIQDLEKFSFKESFHGPFTAANAAVALILNKGNIEEEEGERTG